MTTGKAICRRLLVILLITALVMPGLFLTVPVDNAYAAGETWIEITDVDTLKSISDMTANYRIMSDIDLQGAEWTPFGTFTGTFDGNSKVIRNFTINDTTAANQGLFSEIGPGGTVRQLGIENANITAGNSAGILTGINSGTVEMCYAKGNVSGNQIVGGLIGFNRGVVSNSYASAFVSAQNYAGGLAGSNSGTIDRSYSSSEIAPSVFNNYLVFSGDDYITIPHNSSYNTGTFTLEAWFQWDKADQEPAGDGTNIVEFIISKGDPPGQGTELEQFEIHTGWGKNGIRFIPVPRLIGGDSYLDAKNVIQPGWFHVAAVYDYNNDSARVYVNGVAQDIYINNSNSSIGTTASLPRDTNPLAGNENPFNIGRRTDGSYPFHGKICDVRFWNIARTAEQINADKNKQLTGNEDGLVGYWKLNEKIDMENGVAPDSTSANNSGTLHGTFDIVQDGTSVQGGLVGDNTGGIVTNSYYDSEASGQSDNEGKGVPRSTDEMKAQGTYITEDPGTSWQFGTVWGIFSGSNNGYPYLLAANKAINQFRFEAFDPDVEGVINESTKAITLAVPYGTDVSSLIPTIAYTGTDLNPASGVAQDFSGPDPLAYTVTAENGSTVTYNVTVNIAEPNHTATVSSAIYTVGPVVVGAGTISNVPFGTTRDEFLAGLTKGHSTQTWNSDGIQEFVESGNALIVTAQDGVTQVVYTIAVNASEFSGGNGSVNAPYQITKLEHLDRIRSYLDKHFVLMNDLDFNSNDDYLSIANKTTWTTVTGWSPIAAWGTQFTGSLDFDGHKISGLMCNGGMNIGLFGTVGQGAVIKNGSLKNVAITGTEQVGGLAGTNYGNITCFNTSGTVTGAGVDWSREVGGLVGRNYGTISRSYSTAAVTGINNCGGLVGIEVDGGVITDSYATGSVTIEKYGAGGLVGLLTRFDPANPLPAVNNCYAVGHVTGLEPHGLIGSGNGTVTNSYYDSITSGQSDTSNGQPKVTVLMKTQGTFTGWNFDTVWEMVNTETHYSYPYLKENMQDPKPGHRTRVPQPTIDSFTLAGLIPPVAATIDQQARTIALNTPDGTDLTALTPTISISGTSLSPTSGAAQNFNNSVTYTVTSEDGSTQTYTVLSPVATVTSGAYTVSATGTGSETITNVPYGTTKTELLAAITKGHPDQSWNDTAIHDYVANGDRLIVTSQDGARTIVYTIAVNLNQFAGGHGTSSDPFQITKLEHLDRIKGFLTKHFILMNDLDFTRDEDYLDIGNKAVWSPVKGAAGGWEPIGTSTSASSQFTGKFNGSGHVINGLYINRTADYQGLFGYVGTGAEIKNLHLVGVDVNGQNFVGGLVGYNQGTILHVSSAGNVAGQSHIGGLAGYCKGPVSESFSIADVAGTVNYVGGLAGSLYTSTISNSYATGNVSSTESYVGGLVGTNYGNILDCYASGSVSGKALIGGLLGVNGRNSTVSRSYYVSGTTGQSNTIKGIPKLSLEMKSKATFDNDDGVDDWNFDSIWDIVNTDTHRSYPFLRNNVQDPRPGYAAVEPKAITAFDFEGLEPDVTGVINEDAGTIALSVPYGTDITALVPTITHTGASVTPASGAAYDFTEPVDYTVTAADALTHKYTVTVTVLPSADATITSGSYTIGTAADGAATITNVPYGTSKTAFLAALTKGQENQTWDDTNIDDPVESGNTLVVTAQDGTTAVTYTVTVNPRPIITGFTFAGLDPDANGFINEEAGTIALRVPYGTNITALVPTITHTGANVNPASGEARNFTEPVDYTVTSSDGSSHVYTVTVTVAGAPSDDNDDEDDDDNSTNTSVVMINGKPQQVGTASTKTVGGQVVMNIAVNPQQLGLKLQNEKDGATVTFAPNSDADKISAELTGQMVKLMESKEAVLQIKTGNATYTLPAAQINIDAVSDQISRDIKLADIKVNISVAEPSQNTVRIVEDTANKNSYQVIVKPVEFSVTCTHGGKTVEVGRFNSYVERTVAIPDGIDPGKITTGVVLNADGTFSHVPTKIIVINGKYYARMNSLTNSTYSVIWNPKVFKDVEKHWAKGAVNDMGSRLIISGTGNETFGPDSNITRADFADIIVRALGLMRPGTGKDSFGDVSKNDRYYDAVSISYENGIISGYSNGKFGPDDKITHEQAMTMVARAMKLTGLKSELNDSEVKTLLATLADGAAASGYAKTGIAACLKTGVTANRSGDKIAPNDYMTRAEAAVIVQKLLQKSKLI